jgi:AraC family transcriptional regulator
MTRRFGGAHVRMTGLDLEEFSTRVADKSTPAIVSTLIDGAVATFDADRNASRRYLLRAAAILKATAPHGGKIRRDAHLRGGLAQWQLIRVVDYIEQHLPDRITGEDLASQIGVSIGQLFRAFKASLGIPPLQYVASRRLELACSMLRATREPMSQIALTAGFCDQSHLCRVFKRAVGVTPSAWRRTHASDPHAPGGRGQEYLPTVRWLRDFHKATESGAPGRPKCGLTSLIPKRATAYDFDLYRSGLKQWKSYCWFGNSVNGSGPDELPQVDETVTSFTSNSR